MKTETHHEKPLGSSNSALSGALDRIACTVDLMGSDFIVAAAEENAVLSEPGSLTLRTGRGFVMTTSTRKTRPLPRMFWTSGTTGGSSLLSRSSPCTASNWRIWAKWNDDLRGCTNHRDW